MLRRIVAWAEVSCVVAASAWAQTPPLYPAPQIGAAYSTYAVAAGDVSGDGTIDLVSVGFEANQLAVHLGLGAGLFAPPSFHATGSKPTSVAMGDLNGDGALD